MLEDMNNETFEPDDINNNKVIAGLAYIIFFLPLIVCPHSAYAKFHANQALILFIIGVINGIIGAILPIIGPIISTIIGIISFILFIIGLINGFTGKANRLPLIGGFDIIK